MAASSERGASAMLIAFCLVLLLGMAAFAIDLGFGFNERRDDVTAADMGVMAGAVSSLGSNAQVRDQILSFARQNLPTAYSNAQWQTAWQGCTDPELATLNTTGFHFIPVAPPAGWTVGSPWCISIDPAGFVRVRLPRPGHQHGVWAGDRDQSVRIECRRHRSLELTGRRRYSAFRVGVDGRGRNSCLSAGRQRRTMPRNPATAPTPATSAPWNRLNTGTSPSAQSRTAPGPRRRTSSAINIAVGLDHRVVPDANGLVSDELQDICPVIDSGETPDTLNTFSGLSIGTQEGLATGPVPGGFVPKLQQGTAPKRNVYGSNLDDQPLWFYLDGTLTGVSSGGTIPDSCVRSTYYIGLPQDWSVPADGVLDLPGSWQHISKCLLDHVAMGAGAPIIFLETVGDSARFSYVPQFWESTLPSGNGFLHILRFKSTWLQATWWKKGATTTVFHPGEAGIFSAGATGR